MHRDITVAFPTRHRFNHTKIFLESFYSTTAGLNAPFIYAIHDAPDDHIEVKQTANMLKDGVNVHNYTKQSLTELWNQCIIYSPTDWVLICNDDGVFKPGWLDFLEGQIATGKFLQINLLHYGGMCIHKSLVAQLGWFDERFHGGGFEDIDWQLRLVEAGLKCRVDLSKDFKFMKHRMATKNKWKGLNNTAWMKQKWGRTGSWKQKSFRAEPEIDWHPRYTERYIAQFGVKNLLADINLADWKKEGYNP